MDEGFENVPASGGSILVSRYDFRTNHTVHPAGILYTESFHSVDDEISFMKEEYVDEEGEDKKQEYDGPTAVGFQCITDALGHDLEAFRRKHRLENISLVLGGNGAGTISFDHHHPIIDLQQVALVGEMEDLLSRHLPFVVKIEPYRD